MDGAIILASDGSRVARANVHLVPDPSIPTVGDRHPAPDRRARRSPARRAGHHRVGGHVGRHDPPPRREAHARADPAGAGPRRPGTADPRPLQVAPRRGERLAVGARSRRPRDRPRRRDGAATRRDGASHRRGDRGLRRRARRRRPAGHAPARRADRRGRRRPPARRQGLLPAVGRLRAARRCSHALATLDDELSSTRTRSRGCSTCGPSVGIDSALQPRGFRLLHKIPRLPEIGLRARGRPLREPAEDHAGRRWSISPRSKASARCAPVPSRKVCRASRRRPSSSGTSEPRGTTSHRRSSCPNSRPDPTKSTSSTSR